MFKDCKQEDMPPHIYSVANTAYRTMLRTRSAAGDYVLHI